ncbi:CDP-alcohol phosphatidyltransferase family protein [Solwaraspora sp. WMMD1047]|uniref:CDP-alcohol phosphatidyltransferase family protein n=1 Tax=Solwaraspora sp. WMMD1047 TaxID=3016102 RepID=UPI00241707C2|nr:CDP-alcohol phosphatidyltransferase family protein [Solwaraspora sp. WMMD1047]MDG4832196.1 CDP-alcohol phosphatidyltransferase family protein [Solwaraspora sp. WMMD1047]
MGTRLSWDEYAASWARLHGGFDPRQATPTVRGWLRMAYEVGSVLSRLRVSPTAVTVLGTLLCAAVPLVVARGPSGPLLGAVLILLAAVADSADGAVAVVTGRTSRLGYVYDSVADRLGEAFWLLAFWLVGVPGTLVVTAGALSWLHEYVRARAVSAGMKEIGAVTMGERPSRVSVAIVGLLAAGVTGLIRPELAAGTMTVATTVWVVLAAFGLVQLLAAVRRTLR